MYRQVTLAGAGLGGAGPSSTPANRALPISDVEHAFEDYLQHYNHGRGFVLIGQSQGAKVLKSVIADEIDPNPAVRDRLLSAILMGGNVLVKGDTGIGGDFKHIRACQSNTQLECVIAFSTFDQPAPKRQPVRAPPGLGGTRRSGPMHKPGKPVRRKRTARADRAERTIRSRLDPRRRIQRDLERP
jgi:hypothetical protein